MPRVPPPLARPCKDWCAKNGESWEQKCTYGNSCAGCDACNWLPAMAPPRKPWTRYESLNPQVVAPDLLDLLHPERVTERAAKKKAEEAKQRRRTAVKKRKEEKRGEKRAAKEQAKPKERKARDRKTVQKRAKGRARGRREPLPPLQGLAQGLNPNRGG